MSRQRGRPPVPLGDHCLTLLGRDWRYLSGDHYTNRQKYSGGRKWGGPACLPPAPASRPRQLAASALLIDFPPAVSLTSWLLVLLVALDVKVQTRRRSRSRNKSLQESHQRTCCYESVTFVLASMKAMVQC